jgi:hypothetical protein
MRSDCYNWRLAGSIPSNGRRQFAKFCNGGYQLFAPRVGEVARKVKNGFPSAGD